MKSVFSKLNPKIQNLIQAKNIEDPTEPQVKAIPLILRGKNVLLIAPTGLGKTESALLPVFNNFLLYRKKYPDKKQETGFSILYITPLRALNRDMLKRTFEMGKQLGIEIAVRHGDTSQKERVRQSKNPPDMLITTPETFQILFTGRRLRKHLRSVKWVIVDEIHELAGEERGSQLAVGLERLYELTKEEGVDFQRIGLSATVGSPDEVSSFLGGIKNDCFREVTILQVDVTKHMDLSVKFPSVSKYDYKMGNVFSIDALSFASLRRCKTLIDQHNSTLLFINTRDGAEILASRFHQWKEDFQIGVHHGSLSKNARIETEDDFKTGKIKALICTSSLELGIDLGKTDFVIQYNSPREVQRILQRVGRSGHKIGKTSKGVILATTAEELSESLIIAKNAQKGEIEPLNVRQNPLSVLSNQIISIALEYKKIARDKLYNIITRSYPFYKLKRQLFDKIIEQLYSQRIIWKKDDFIYKKRKSRTYFLDNVSMIPDEKTYKIVDISTRKQIGRLDESFVLNYGFEGAKFILKGIPWNIVKKEDEEILVSQSKELGNIPSWIGEDIPVPHRIAMEVGRLRRAISNSENIDDYPSDTKTLKKIKQQIDNQQKQGFVVPDDKNITIEVEDKTVVINACFGTKVNETLGRIISAMLAQSIGESIGINSDAYRINLELPGRVPVERIQKILLQIKPKTLDYLLRTVLKNSTYIRWEIVHAARKFGALRKDFDYKHVGSKKLFTLFDSTLIFDEAVEKIIWDKMDVEQTAKVLTAIQNGSINIHRQRLSPISLAGVETIRGLMMPQKATRSILMALKKRLEDTDVTMACTNCGYTWDKSLRRVKDKPKCSKCGAIKIAVLRRYNKDLAKLINKKQLDKNENKELRRLHKNASLVISFGRAAVMSLMGRGIGPDTAARILRKYDPILLKKDENLQMKFLREILKAELNYARTRGFWDDN